MDKPTAPNIVNSIYTMLLFRGIILLALIYSLNQERYLAALFLLLFLILVEFSALISRNGVKNSQISRTTGRTRIFPNQEANFKFTIKNQSRLPIKIRWFQPVPSYVAAPDGNEGNIYIRAKRRQQIKYKLVPQKRGYYLLPSIFLQSMDPFGIFLRELTVRENFELIVYPELTHIDEIPKFLTGSTGNIKDDRGLILDPIMIAGLRDYTPDTPAKLIAWKASAGRGRLLTKVLESTTEQLILIGIDVDCFVDKDPEFEKALSIAATIASLADEERIPFGLISNFSVKGLDSPAVTPIGRDEEQILIILETLARAERNSCGTFQDLLSNNVVDIPWGTTLLMVGDSKADYFPRQINKTINLPIENTGFYDNDTSK